MARNPGTKRDGTPFSYALKWAVWNKAALIKGLDPLLYRKDVCGALIEWKEYGVTTEGGTGWEIDHKKPVAIGGTDDLINLQALQWQNNRHKADAFPAGDFCVVRHTVSPRLINH